MVLGKKTNSPNSLTMCYVPSTKYRFLEFYPGLGGEAPFERMLHAFHLGHKVSQTNDPWWGTPPSQDNVLREGTPLEGFNDFRNLQEFTLEGNMDLIENDQIILGASK